ncbi:MAG TPA: EamA family transporter [Actinomycetota bacterium]
MKVLRRPSLPRLFAKGAVAQGSPSPALIWLALGIVYVIWGSTYFAIREAILTIPPLLMASVRFLVAGALLYAWAIRRGDRTGDRPGAKQWLAAFAIGTSLLLVGNGGVVLAERSVPTGIVALIIATVPLWMALIDRAFFGQRLAPQAILGLALGFAGLALLVGNPGGGHIRSLDLAIALIAPIGWSIGSMYSRRAALPRRALVATAMEMLCGGLVLGVAGVLHGELARVHPDRFSLHSILGLAYLVVFGSWIAFSAYIWLLKVAPVSLVSTYAYVNPVVAVFLGWAFLSERVGPRTLVAAAVIVAAVALILSARKLPPGDPAGAAPTRPAWIERPDR